MITIGAVAVWVAQTRRDAVDQLKAQCITRVATRDDLRGVFIGIYDYLDPTDEKPRINDLRMQLDDRYPKLSLEDC